MQIPKLNQDWCGYRLRRGAPSDRQTIKEWVETEPDLGIRGMVQGTAERAAEREPGCLILHDLALDLPVGCYQLGTRFFNVMFLKEGCRGRKLGLRGAIVCVQHFFDARDEDDLGVDQVYPAGRGVLDALGFGSPLREFDECTLTRIEWTARCVVLAELFRGDRW